jgi:signal transduction histidine kinase
VKFHSLYSRIAVVFAAVLIAFGTLLGWLSYRAAKVHQHEVMQRLSRDLASHMSSRGPLIGAAGPDRNAVRELFQMAVVVNPMIEAYLLDADGLILANSAPQGRLARERVALAPIHAFMRGDPLPVLGDSPRDASRRDIFSATPLKIDNRTAGYLYVLLVGGMYRQLGDEALQGFAVRSVAWIGAAGLGLALLVGLAAFAKITRPLNRLTRSVQAFEHQDSINDHPHAPARYATGAASDDEISRLAAAFERMSGQLKAQMHELQRQDGLRRELVANVSHDLRTPLTSMQNHLETLLRSGDDLANADRQRYLEVAVRQSQRVARLVQQLFELAQLECEETLPGAEIFSLSELLQDITQKFALVAADKAVQLVATVQPLELFVRGDIGMIERVITNLLDNAIRHTPAGGSVSLEAVRSSAAVEVRVADTGVGIAAEHLPGLFERGSPLRRSAHRSGGGLGLRIAGRILALHGTRISVASEVGCGTTFRFALPVAQPG